MSVVKRIDSHIPVGNGLLVGDILCTPTAAAAAAANKDPCNTSHF